jgi:hypothetical protein
VAGEVDARPNGAAGLGATDCSTFKPRLRQRVGHRLGIAAGVGQCGDQAGGVAGIADDEGVGANASGTDLTPSAIAY